ncbi:MAG: redox-regulated ATPase YchF [Planctomycetes bacterium]|nr:redox-regulated ATPase YchF [Planctomycetota bacterium]
MKVALIGMMQSGKSTIMSAISGKAMPPVGSVNIEEVIVPVPDERLDWLTDLYKPKKTVCGTVDCLDLPALSFTDESGRSAARRLFGKVRTVDMFVVVVRAFVDASVPPYGGSINPVRDINDLKTEFLLADLELVMTRIERLEKQIHKPTKTQSKDKAELALQKKLQEALEAEKPISSVIEHDVDMDLIKSLGFLTLKPMMVVVNIGEDQIGEEIDLSGAADESTEIVTMCAKIESEIAELDDESKAEFMNDMGIDEPASIKFVQSCYKTLGLISFLTVGPDEVRAWPIRGGISALDAAGKIHSDIQRGFIRAETIAYDDLKVHGSEKDCKAAGKTRLEGKTYVIQDGDIINFRFNV